MNKTKQLALSFALLIPFSINSHANSLFGSFAQAMTGTPAQPVGAEPVAIDPNIQVTPIAGSAGEFMSPYTEDNTIAPWVTKAINAKAGANIGGAVGAYAAQDAVQRAAGYIPFAGMFAGQIGKSVGSKAGREIAISSSGGWEFIKANTDISFSSLSDMTIYLLKNNRSHGEFDAAISATAAIYPDLKTEMLKYGYVVK